jgi:hypothetical protein
MADELKSTYTTQSDKDGNFSITLPPTEAYAMEEELKQEPQSSETEKTVTATVKSDDVIGKSQGNGSDSGKPTTEMAKVGYKMPPIEHRFKPGQVANPSGKPKTKHIRDAAIKISGLTAEQLETYKPKTVLEQATVELFKTILNPNRNSSAAVQAFNALADRIDGKPKPSDEELDSNQNKNILVIPGGLMNKQPNEE